MARAVILGTGSGAPDRVITNRDLESRLDTSDEWITQRTGIQERRMVDVGGKWSDFIVPACKAALEMAEVDAGELDMIIAGTLSPDMFMPSGGCTLQAALGAKRAVAYDVGAACSGFIYGLTIADRFIKADPKMKILVAGGEVISQRIDWDDRTTAVLFGDGGGAAVLAGSDDPDRGILASRIHSDGTLWELLYVPGGASQHPPGPETEQDGKLYVRDVEEHEGTSKSGKAWRKYRITLSDGRLVATFDQEIANSARDALNEQVPVQIQTKPAKNERWDDDLIAIAPDQDAPLSAEQSAAAVRRVLANATVRVSGKFFNYDGTELPW